MAPQTPDHANRFAHSKSHLAPHYNKHSAQSNTSTMTTLATCETSDHQTDTACEPLCVHVERIVRQYFTTLGDDIPTDLYDLILKEVERPLLTVVLEQTRGNQSKCAQILGLNRGTLRKKLKTYHLM